MGGVLTFLDEIVIDLFGCEEYVVNDVVLSLQQLLVVIQFSGD